MWFCSARSDSTNSISLAFHAFFMCCMRCHDAMMPCLCAYLFLLLAVLLAAACLVVEVAAGPVNRLLLAWLFCDFSHPPSLDLNLGGGVGAHLKLICLPPRWGVGVVPLLLWGLVLACGLGHPGCLSKGGKSCCRPPPIVAWCCCLDMLSRDSMMTT